MKKSVLLAPVITLCFLIGFLPSLFAGGSVELSEIWPMIEQQPQLWNVFAKNLDISTKGGGVRLGSEGIPLRGYRVGPYEFPARIKGSKGDYPFKIVINTELFFWDSRDRLVTDEKKATKVEEVLTSISLAPALAPKRSGSFVRSSD